MRFSQELSKPEKPTSEERLRWLLKRDDLDLWDIEQLLRGTSLDLYCVLVVACDQNGRCQITQRELLLRTGIGNTQTLQKQEIWLESLGLIKRFIRLGDCKGSEYQVYSLKTFPLPAKVFDQLDSHLKTYNELFQSTE